MRTVPGCINSFSKYTITFDTNGGSEIAPIAQDYGTAITAPANPTRKGYTFKGWDKEIPLSLIHIFAENLSATNPPTKPPPTRADFG